MNTLADRLKHLMAVHGRRQVDLARACDVKAPSVQAWLDGKTLELKGNNLLALAKLFDVHESWIQTGKGAKWRSAEAAARAGEVALFEAVAEETPTGFDAVPIQWPMPSVAPGDFYRLPPDLRSRVDAYVRGLVDSWKQLNDT